MISKQIKRSSRDWLTGLRPTCIYGLELTGKLISFSAVRMEGVLKEGVPTSREIAALARYIVEIWKRLGRALGIEEAVIAEIRLNEDNVYERAFMMLNRWRQQMGAQANYEALAQALGCEEIGRADLIQRFCYTVGPRGNCSYNICLIGIQLISSENIKPRYFLDLRQLFPIIAFGGHYCWGLGEDSNVWV